ncbi:hypothetical protein PTSG_08749 [Salpingoeca rosetta]|uniref:Protein transport protein Sec61 subunit beta n=1 Tax=Salpingoeca rosetta (strain ATCC 50818 / BSB-021) TaxID=946362 RepID=F2UKK8_SALR5|nr:uncharacterized protein PTSG_08749 [Salpingoeca rosetta]EGD77657.1 hypothetical protein PTSG_08749 [Salpingoeca rosetta]|eukprot:XP_004990133.1 hypothetical protein PTSG_08749 [Salpingoeca rosetta]
MPVKPSSATDVNRGGSGPTRRVNAAAASRARGKAPKTEAVRAPRQNADAALIYKEGATGAQVDPYTVLIFSVAFIASVFLLHIWAKFSS